MSATLGGFSTRDEAVYGRLFREGRADVLAHIEREFPKVSPEEREDVASVALLEMVRRRMLCRWEPGAIGAWSDLAKQRMVDELRRSKRREQRARLKPMTHGIGPPPLPEEEIEAALSDWRAVELMAQMPPRAATFVRLRVLEGGSRADVMVATGWSAKQYEKAQSAAKSALRSTLANLDSSRRCAQYRRLIDRLALRDELPVRKRRALHAHVEHCGRCRAYSQEARRTLHVVAPLFGLLPAGAGAGGAILGVGSVVGLSVPTGMVAKGAAIMCAGALCLGGAYVALHDDEARPRHEVRTSAPLQVSPSMLASPGTASRSPISASAPSRPRREGDETLGLDSRTPEPAARLPVQDLAPAPVEPPSHGAESAFGLGASSQSPPAPSGGCVPGELGC
jgi:DNA-directed RNA polymerase specialized sigma24 family protein